MKVHIHIPPAEAIKASRDQCGNLTIELSAEDLASLTEDQRALLAGMHGVGEEATSRSSRLQSTDATVAEVILALQTRIDQRAATEAKKKAEKDEATTALDAWVTEHEGDPASLVEEDPRSYHGELRVTDGPTIMESDHPLLKRRAALRTAAREIMLEREAATKAEREVREKKVEACKAAERAAHEAERATWIGEHGSRRLQLLAEEGIGLAETYRAERLDLERPDWEWATEVCGVTVGLRDAAESALDSLIAQRKIAPGAALMWLQYDDCDCCAADEGECQYTDRELFRPRAVLTAQFLGREILYDHFLA